MGIKSIFVIFKFSWWKLSFLSGWNARFHAIGYFYDEHTVAFYAIIIIILLIIVFVIYLEVNSQEDYLIRPYQVLLGISLVAIVIYIIASAPEQTEYFKWGTYGTKEIETSVIKDPYEDEKQWLTDESACQNLEEEKNKYYCIEIKYQCSVFLISKEEPRYAFDEGHLKPTTFEKCADQLREKFKIGIGSFEEEFADFQSFLIDKKTIDGDGKLDPEVSIKSFISKPQDITGDYLRISVVKILTSAFETNEGNLEKVWLEVESQLTEKINKIIKDAYDIDDVVANGFGDAKVPFYTLNFVNRFKRVKISYQPTEQFTRVELTEKLQKVHDLLVNDLNKINDQIDKITGHTDPSAKTILERLNEKREKIQEDIFKLKYALKNSND